MNPAQLQAQAQQSAAQGQQLLSQDQAQSSTAQGNYNQFAGQANQAAGQEQAESQYMQGAGSGANVYGQQLQNQINQFEPNIQGQLAGANKSLFGLTGALNGAIQQFNTPGGVGAYGLSAPALAGYASSVLQPLQTGVSYDNTQVGTLNNQLGTLETGASQGTSAQVQSEQNVLTGYAQAAATYQAQASDALQNMQFYSNLAQQQGGLNAQQQQEYAQVIQGYTQAAAAMESAQAAMKQAQVASSIAPSTIAAQQAQAAATQASILKNQSGSSNSGGLKVTTANPGSLSLGTASGVLQ